MPKISLTCPICGKHFLASPSSIKPGIERRCSRTCRNFRHGQGGNDSKTRTKTYVTWNNMLNRCKNKSNPKYHLYGGAGITVCEYWLKFVNFLSDMGDRPDGKTIDRIDPSLGYFKENCKWATPIEQSSHLKHSKRIHLKNGDVVTLSELSRRTGIAVKTLSYRLKNNWDIDRLTSNPHSSKTSSP